MHYAILILSILLSLFLTGDMVHAEQPWNKWLPKNGTAVRQGNAVEWSGASAVRTEGELTGEIAYVWEDTRDGCRGVAMQVIGPDGNPKFEENGIRLFSCEFVRLDPHVTPTPDGGWIVAWQDFRRDIPDVYYTKVNSQGELLWGTDNVGLAVNCEHAYFGLQTIEDGQGGCFIVWGTALDGRGTDIYATHVLNDGSLDNNWQEGGNDVSSQDVPDNYFTLTTDGDGGFIIAWLHSRNHEVDMLVQRVSVRGERLWSDREEVTHICYNTVARETPQIAPDGSGGIFICWADFRDLDNNAEDIYIQRIDRDGNLMWDEAGVALATGELQQLHPQIVAADPGYAVVAWESNDLMDHRTDIYAMMISGEDEPEFIWAPEDGAPVVVAENDQRQVNITCDVDNGFLFTWADARDGRYPSDCDIWAQLIDYDGEYVWDENGVPVCQAEDNQSNPLIYALDNGDCIVTWHPGEIIPESGINAQILTVDGDPVEGNSGFDIVNGIYGDARYPQLISLSDGEFAVVWADTRYGASQGVTPMVQFYRDNGGEVVPQIQENGIRIVDSTSIYTTDNIPAVSDGDGGVIILWEENGPRGSFKLHAARITADGERLWGENGIVVSEAELDFQNTKACSDGNGGVYLGYQTYLPANMYSEIHIQHLDEDGQRYWNDRDVRLFVEDTDCTIQQITLGDNGSAVVLWEAEAGWHDEYLLLSCISDEGEHLWDNEPGIRVSGNEPTYGAGMVVHPEGYAVTWLTTEDDRLNYHLRGQFIENDGTKRWQMNGSTICGYNSYKSTPQMDIDDDGFIWVVWTDDRVEGEHDNYLLFMQKMESVADEVTPRLLFEEDGRQITANENQQFSTQIVHDGENGMWLSWSSFERDRDQNVFATHLNPDGEIYEPWDADGNMVCDVSHDQRLNQAALLRESGEDGLILIWVDERSSDGGGHQAPELPCEGRIFNNLYMQRIDDFSPDVVDDDNVSSVETFEIAALYPNPFNSRFSFEFTLNRSDIVHMKLYDLTGRQLWSMSRRFGVGEHRQSVDLNLNSAGVYFLRAESSFGTDVQRVVMLK